TLLGQGIDTHSTYAAGGNIAVSSGTYSLLAPFGYVESQSQNGGTGGSITISSGTYTSSGVLWSGQGGPGGTISVSSGTNTSIYGYADNTTGNTILTSGGDTFVSDYINNSAVGTTGSIGSVTIYSGRSTVINDYIDVYTQSGNLNGGNVIIVS